VLLRVFLGKTPVEGYEPFYIDKNYIAVKNSYFNYLNRKKAVKKCFHKNIRSDGDLVIVDVGCGISPVSPNPRQTLFVDCAKDALKYLAQKGHQTMHGDITDLPLDENYADVVFCSEVLEHEEDYKNALKEMYRILKKGGHLILTVPVHEKYRSFDDQYFGHLTRFDPGLFRQELTDVGFRIIEDKPIGSWLEKKLTQLGLKIFLHQKNKKPFGKLALTAGNIVNYLWYLGVRASLLFTSEESTSVMLYCCRKE
jgi:ubiquinone/menaquinone biosynthesis C-methylase UbiE